MQEDIYFRDRHKIRSARASINNQNNPNPTVTHPDKRAPNFSPVPFMMLKSKFWTG